MKLTADLHIHSHYSRATSKDLTFEHLWKWAQIKGVHIVGTGDIAHPGWLREMREKLEPAEEGLFRLKDEIAAAMRPDVPAACQGRVRFLLAGEISNIYKRHDAVRKVHNVIFAPSLAAVEKIQTALEKIGNIRADGRPILGLDSRDLLEIILGVDERCHLIPAHIWTPWFSMLGSKSGFDSVEECFGDLTPYIFAVETGLSSDPPMNWRVSDLDRYTLVSNSDAHSPQKLGREATLFDIELGYDALFDALRSGDPAHFLGTVEFFPEEGKYHMDGHRKCNVCWHPQTTRSHSGRCTVCGKPVTVGVMHRVEALADRPEGERPPRTHPFHSLIPLPEILAEVHKVGVNSKSVQAEYLKLLARLGPELDILRYLPLEEIAAAGGEPLAAGIGRMRQGQISADPGYDGEYGVVRVLGGAASGQMTLFEEEKAKGKRQSAKVVERPASYQETPITADLSSAISPLPQSPVSSPQSPVPDLQSLNSDQRAAVLHDSGPLLIVAGPGTGKTRTLTARIAYGVTERGAAPEAALAITFTNKAAEEMAERLDALLGEERAGRVTVKTFHALGAQILHEWGERVGLSAEFAILGDEDRALILRRACPDLSESEVAAALEQISTAKNELYFVDDGGSLVRLIDSAEDAPLWMANFGEIYRRYEEALRQSNALDFDHLILRTVRLCQDHADVLEALRHRFRHISVDEYQDLNLAQYWLLRLLAGDGRNLCVIGDPDQAIYGFRGADHRYFHRFEQDYPGATRLSLRRNYRSAAAILAAATDVIAKNPDRAELSPLAEFADQVKLNLYTAPTDSAEAEYVVHQIEELVGGTSYFSLDSGRVADETRPVERSFADFAVLYRLNAQSRPLQEAFERSGIPYQIVGQRSFYAQKGVRAILDLFWLWTNPRSRVHWERVLTVDRRPPAAATVAEVTAIFAGADRGMIDGLGRALYANGLTVAQRDRVMALTSLYQQWQNHPVLIERIEMAERFWTEQGSAALSEEDRRRLLGRAFSFGERVTDFLVSTALQGEGDDYDPRADRVTLTTIHAAKGLEFPVVFVVGCEAGITPYLPANRKVDLAEERRLFYVAITRAGRKLILTHARRRVLYGQAMENNLSPFVEDIEEALLELRQAQARPRPKAAENVQLSLF
ncbi:MAG: UvrD-helicase domain-containing protein [Caldilineaceae bacterium]|nr:UvrD-helicase domain-containing protein [Caldilineaceae bacterium]